MQCLVAFDSYLQYPFGRVIETVGTWILQQYEIWAP